MSQELQEIINSIIKDYPKDKRSPDELIRQGSLWNNTEIGKKFTQALNKIPKYSPIERCLQCIGSHFEVMNFEILQNWLVNRARRTSSEQAFQELDKYISSDKFKTHVVELIAEVQTDCEYTFCNGVKLMQARNIDNSHLVEDFDSEICFRLPFPVVASAFSIPYDQPLIHLGKLDHGQLDKTEKQQRKELEKLYKEIIDTRMLLSLVTDAEYGIFPIAYTVMLPDNIPFARPYSPWTVVPSKYTKVGLVINKEDCERTNELLSNFIKLTPGFKDKLRVALSLFNDFGNEESWVSKSISLRMCLETIFLDDGNKEQLRYRLALRAALFLEQSLEKRKEIQQNIKKAYDLTSTAIHTGKTPKLNDIHMLEVAAELARMALHRMINENGVDWTELELGK